MTIMDDGLQAITAEETTAAITDDLYEKVKGQWTEFDTRYRARRGAQFKSEGFNQIMGLIRAYGPKLAVFAGLPGLGTLLGSMGTEGGSFSLMGLFGKIGGLFGLG